MEGCEELTLTNGELQFTAWSRGTGPCVLLIHGFPDLPQTWASVMEALAAAGYRAVAVTSRGYETRSQPRDDNYQLTALAEDVIAWMDSLGESKAHLVGHDWGAALTCAAAVSQPDRVNSLCMVSVPHSGRFAETAARSLRQLWRSRYIIMFQFKGLAERRLAKNESEYLSQLWHRWSPGWEAPQSHVIAVRKRFQVPGVIEGTLGYYRQGADTKTPVGQASRALAAKVVPVRTLGVYGDRDDCIGTEIYEAAMDAELFSNGLDLEQIPDCGHFPQLEKPERFNELLLGWLDRGTNGKRMP